MSGVNWGLLAAYPNAGESFNNAFQQGMKTNQELAGRNALATLVQNPNDPKALADLARSDPERAMEYRKQQAVLSKDEHEKWAKTVGLAAKAATTPEQWDQTIDQFVAAGHTEAAQLKGKFSPALRQAFMAQGGIEDDNAPGAIREFQEAGQLGYLPQGTTYEQFLQMKNPGMLSPVNVPYGATVTAPGQTGGGNVPQVHDQASYDAIPPGSQYMTPDGHMRVKGGSTAQAPSSGFPGQ